MNDGFWHKAKQMMGLEGETQDLENAAEKEPENGRFLKFRSTKKNTEDADCEIDICEPKVYEDSLGISYRLRQGNPVIINLRSLEQNEGTRLIDFVCGAAYAINGHMTKIGESIFLFTPSNIAITDIGEKASLSEDFKINQQTTFFSN